MLLSKIFMRIAWRCFNSSIYVPKIPNYSFFLFLRSIHCIAHSQTHMRDVWRGKPLIISAFTLPERERYFRFPSKKFSHFSPENPIAKQQQISVWPNNNFYQAENESRIRIPEGRTFFTASQSLTSSDESFSTSPCFRQQVLDFFAR